MMHVKPANQRAGNVEAKRKAMASITLLRLRVCDYVLEAELG